MKKQGGAEIILFLALSLGPLGCQTQEAAVPTKPPAAQLEAVTGSVFRSGVEDLVMLAKGDVLEDTQVLETSRTGGSAVLRLREGSRLTLGAGSRLRISGPTGLTSPTQIAEWGFLESGLLRVESNQVNRRPLRIGTPHGAVTVGAGTSMTVSAP